MSTSGLTPAGSATYDSGTMYVGDGTWDSSSNTFLLPNLQGLNYATTRYNGMGNRFASMPGYYSLVLAHGILAALVFLFIVPFAVMVNRFHWRNRYWKLRLHIWAQVLTVLLTTVVFILGCFQVGPDRSFTNPHHGIGLALYVLVLVQFVGGYMNYRRSKRGKGYIYKPLRVVLHHWLGRVIALLGIVQVALGLTLYGSPLSLFVLYAIVVFILLLTYFILDFMRQRDQERVIEDQSSYLSGSGPAQHDGHKHRLAEGALLGGGLGLLANRWRNRRRSSGRQNETDIYSEHDSQAHSGYRPGVAGESSYVTNEKISEYDQPEPEKHTWRNRLLGLGALGGLGYLFGRRRKDRREEDYDGGSSYYYSETSGGTLERVEEGRLPPATPTRPAAASVQNTPGSQERLTGPVGHRRSHSSMSESSLASSSPSKLRPRRGIRDGLLGLGTLGAAKGFFDFRKRRERKEQRRIEELRQQEAEDEKVQRANSRKYTGNNFPKRFPRRGSVTSSATASQLAPASVVGPGSSGPQTGARPIPGAPPVMSGAIPPGSGPLAARPPIHDPGTGTYVSTNSRPSTAADARSHVGTGPHTAADLAATGLAGAAAGAALNDTSHNRRESRNSRDQTRTSAGRRSQDASPATPVSVKLNMHPDGRHVTLRRLTEEEAARERESKRTRNRSRRRRAGSGNASGPASTVGSSALSRLEPPNPRFARTQRDTTGRTRRTEYAAGTPASSVVTSVVGAAPAPVPATTPAQPGQGAGAPYLHGSGSTPLPMSEAGITAPPSQLPPPQQQHSASISAQSLMPASVSTVQGGRMPSPSVHFGNSPMSHPGSVGSPGVYDPSTDTGASQMSNYAENRKRRRAQRAQAAAARAAGGKTVEFE